MVCGKKNPQRKGEGKRKKKRETKKRKKNNKGRKEVEVFVTKADYYTCWVVELPWRYKLTRTCAMSF